MYRYICVYIYIIFIIYIIYIYNQYDLVYLCLDLTESAQKHKFKIYLTLL